VLESALEGEITDHVGYEKHDPAGKNHGNSRNGTRAKTVLTDVGPVEVKVPRDTAGTFEPQIVRKRQRRLTGVDEMVLSLSAKGLTHGEISAHLAEVYGAEVSKQTISTITDKVVEGMAEWQSRPLDRGRFLSVDAINVKIRDGQVANRPVYVVMAVTVDGKNRALLLRSGSAKWLEKINGGEACLAVDEAEGDFGSSCQVKGTEAFGVEGVDDAVESRAEQGGGSAQRRLQGDTVGCSTVKDDVARAVEASHGNAKRLFDVGELVARICDEGGHPAGCGLVGVPGGCLGQGQGIHAAVVKGLGHQTGTFEIAGAAIEGAGECVGPTGSVTVGQGGQFGSGP